MTVVLNLSSNAHLTWKQKAYFPKGWNLKSEKTFLAFFFFLAIVINTGPEIKPNLRQLERHVNALIKMTSREGKRFSRAAAVSIHSPPSLTAPPPGWLGQCLCYWSRSAETLPCLSGFPAACLCPAAAPADSQSDTGRRRPGGWWWHRGDYKKRKEKKSRKYR